jgi:hypothetical protein
LNDAGKDGDQIAGDGTYSAYFRDTKTSGIYTFRILMRDASSGRQLAVSREKTLSALVVSAVDPKKSNVSLIRETFNERANMTRLDFRVVPVDRFGDQIGPGNAALIKLDVRRGRVVHVVDRLDGSYEVEMVIKGEYDQGVRLVP